MRALLLYPEFPPSLWSFENILELVGRKVLFPPLGLATVAALLPASWEIKLVDCNIRRPTEEEWEWAQLVMISGMLAQKNSLLAAIREAKRRGKAVAVGGPYATALPDEPAAAGADYLALDEGEITVPMLLRALEEGKTQGVFRADGARPAMADSPMPRFDLYDFAACDSMSVQFTRGCPFCCEFCDVIELFGRAPRSKSPEQLLAELERLYELGWRRSVFIVDDNFIGDRNRARQLLKQLIEWQRRHYYPFSFDTQASIDLARDDELLRLMADANFGMIFLGIETPDLDSLEAVGKRQNTRQPMLEAIEAIQRAGMVPAAGLIIGFDGEAPGAGRRKPPSRKPRSACFRRCRTPHCAAAWNAKGGCCAATRAISIRAR